MNVKWQKDFSCHSLFYLLFCLFCRCFMPYLSICSFEPRTSHMMCNSLYAGFPFSSSSLNIFETVPLEMPTRSPERNGKFYIGKGIKSTAPYFAKTAGHLDIRKPLLLKFLFPGLYRLANQYIHGILSDIIKN